MDFIAQPPFGSDTDAVADNQHPHHQYGINRRGAEAAVERLQLRFGNCCSAARPARWRVRTRWLNPASFDYFVRLATTLNLAGSQRSEQEKA
jgi:hypothetical protein